MIRSGTRTRVDAGEDGCNGSRWYGRVRGWGCGCWVVSQVLLLSSWSFPSHAGRIVLLHESNTPHLLHFIECESKYKETDSLSRLNSELYFLGTSIPPSSTANAIASFENLRKSLISML